METRSHGPFNAILAILSRGVFRVNVFKSCIVVNYYHTPVN